MKNAKSDNSRPMIFQCEEAFHQLASEGVVYTFRGKLKPNGPIWVRRTRTGKKEFDAVRKLAEKNIPPREVYLRKYDGRSGFNTVSEWQNKIKELHGDTSGYIYKVTKDTWQWRREHM